MKRSILTLILLATLALSTTLLSGCGKSAKEEPAQTEPVEVETASPAVEEVAYACPMHPEITGKEGDTCSKCGMDLEKVEAGHDSTHQHE